MRSPASTCPAAASLARRRPARIRAIWNGEGELESKTGPRPTGNGPTLLVGGYVGKSLERAAKYGDGWTQGGAGPDQFKQDAAKLDEAWKRAGRDGKPYKMLSAYFALGPDAQKNAEKNLGDYYAWLGEGAAQGSSAAQPRTRDTVKRYLAAFEAAGCDELILFPASSDPAQVGLLAEAAGL